MKNKYYINGSLFLMLVFCLWTINCSSLPKKTESRNKTFAHMNMRMAYEAQKEKDYIRAVRLFNEAYNNFTFIDNIKGKIDAGLSVARQYFYLGKTRLCRQWLERISGMIRGEFAYLEASKLLLMAEMSFEKEEFNEVIMIGENVVTDNHLWNMELRSYVMISRLKLGKDYSVDQALLEKDLPVFYKKFKKNKLKDPEVLSLAYYNLAYVNIFQKKWDIALRKLEKAREIDAALDNSSGLANDLLAMGHCLEFMGRNNDAKQCFRRASEIFILLKEPNKAKAALKKVNKN